MGRMLDYRLVRFMGRTRHEWPALFLQLIHQARAYPVRFHRVRHALTPLDLTTTYSGERLCSAEALAFGKTAKEVTAEGRGLARAHRVFEEPTVEHDSRRAAHAEFWQAHALYEHSVFTQGVIWHLDSFDNGGRVGRCSPSESSGT